MQERRKYLRFNTAGSVVLKTGDGTPAIIKAELFNISSEGFSAYAPQKIEAGANVRFELSVNSWNEPIIGEGKIRYMHETKRSDGSSRVGIEFSDIDKKAIQHIINNIQAEICSEARRKGLSKRRSF